MSAVEAQMLPKDALTVGVRMLQASAEFEVGEPGGFGMANVAVERILDMLTEAEVREVAAALALIPRIKGANLTEVAELDALACSIVWAYSHG